MSRLVSYPPSSERERRILAIFPSVEVIEHRAFASIATVAVAETMRPYPILAEKLGAAGFDVKSERGKWARVRIMWGTPG